MYNNQYLCSFFQLGDTVKILLIELYIRAITIDLNLVEIKKYTKRKEEVREICERLGVGFLRLADVLKSNTEAAHECTLTSFSHNPTDQCFGKIEVIGNARERLKEIQRQEKMSLLLRLLESKIVTRRKAYGTQGNNSAQRWRSNRMSNILSRIKGTRATKSKTTRYALRSIENVQIKHRSTQRSPTPKFITNYQELISDALRIMEAESEHSEDSEWNSISEDSSDISLLLDPVKNDLPQHLCLDLAVILKCRYGLLSWDLDWKDLKTKCLEYMKNFDVMQSENKELKFLHIDFSKLKRKKYKR